MYLHGDAMSKTATHSLHALEFASVALSWFSLGYKLSRLPQLKGIWAHKHKQAMKVSRDLSATSTNKDVLAWLRTFEDLSPKVRGHFKSAGTTGPQMLQARIHITVG